MSITPEQARALLDGATPGPWTMHRYVPEDFIRVTGQDLKDIAANGVVEDGDARIIAAAPDLAQTIAGMTEQWGVNIDGTVTWMNDRDMAEDAIEGIEAGRLVRRLVGPVEVTE